MKSNEPMQEEIMTRKQSALLHKALAGCQTINAKYSS